VRHSPGRTLYSTATSLDGFIADEHHSLDWLDTVDGGDGPGEFGEFYAGVGAMAMGASTYEWLLRQEDFRRDGAAAWRRAHGDTPCWVFAHRELPVLPGTAITFVQGDVVPVHRELVDAAAGRNVWLVVGGGLVAQFAAAGLLDEIALTVAPVTLGRGAPLLPLRLDASQLELVDVSRRGQFVRLAYAVRRS
jgi:dihydrofolate reductase